MKELLSNKGSLFIHIDWRTSALIRLILDELFGSEFFEMKSFGLIQDQVPLANHNFQENMIIYCGLQNLMSGFLTLIT